MTSIIDKLNTIGNFNDSIKGIENFNSNYKGINGISEINDKREGRILKNKEFELTGKLQKTLGKLKQVVDGVNKFTRTDLNVLKEISKNTGPAQVKARGPTERELLLEAAARQKNADAFPQATPPPGGQGQEQGEAPAPPVTAQVPVAPVTVEGPKSQQYPDEPIVLEGEVGKYLTPEQQKEFDRINKNLNKQGKIELDKDNLSTIPPSIGESGIAIQWGNNPIWIGKIYTDERGEYKEGGYDVFMKNDGFSVVDKMPLNPAVLFSGENATIQKDGSNNYVLLEKDKKNNYGFVFEYKGTVGTLSSYFGIDEGKTGGKKKSKSKRTKKNGSLKKRK